jgi:hypothetical protein
MTLNIHPLSGGSFVNLVKLLSSHQVEPQYWPTTLTTAALSLAGSPFRAMARLQYNKKVDQLVFKEDPIFILGHWRSGTTHLHNLMSQDKSLGYLSSYQAWTPELFLQDLPTTRFIVKNSLPKKRLIDNLDIAMHLPQEEEFSMANLSLYSYFHAFYFPLDTRSIFDKSVLFKGIAATDKALWEKLYVRTLKSASFAIEGKRLVVKNPANTARISTLIKLFPNAKFIHIYRNPYIVFFSKINMYRKLLGMWKLQNISLKEVEENILYIYRELMQRYFDERSLIPPNNLIEVRYEDFEVDQINTVEKIYSQLSIPHFEQMKDALMNYIKAQEDYKKNSHSFDSLLLDRVYSHWHFTIDRWGYSPPVVDGMKSFKQSRVEGRV